MSKVLKKYPSWPMYFCVIVGVIILGVIAGRLWPSMAQEATSTFIPMPISRLSAKQDVIRYIAYSPQVFSQLADRRRVLFFEANWCSTCKDADQNLSANTDKIPSDVTVFKVDYDTANDLKQKYGITAQHSFVQVDAQGNAIKVWNGGEIAELLSELKP